MCGKYGSVNASEVLRLKGLDIHNARLK